MIIHWFGHASLMIETQGKYIAIDPCIDPLIGIPMHNASIVLISRWHHEHISLHTLGKIRGENTMILGTKESATEILGCALLRPGEKIDIEGLTIMATPTKTISRRRLAADKTDKVGFLITSENKTIFYPGDTKFVEDFSHIKADVVLVPVGGMDTMNYKEAAELVQFLRPKIAIPIHWGRFAGTRDDAEMFKEIIEREKKTEVKILEENERLEV